MAKTIKTETTNKKEDITMKEKLISLIKGYDLYCFEKDGWEGAVAEAQNNKIKKEFFEIIESLGYRMSNKDFMDIMNAVHRLDSTVTAEEIANKIIKKEEKAMNLVKLNERVVIDQLLLGLSNVENKLERAMVIYTLLDQIEERKVKKDTVLRIAKISFGMEVKSSTTKAEAMSYIKRQADKLVDEDDMGIEKSQSTVTTEQVQDSQEQVTATHQVVCIDHAYYDDEFIAFEGTKNQCEEYADIHNRIDGETGIASYIVEPVDVSVGDLDITKDNAPQQEASEADIEADNAEQQVQAKRAKLDKMFGTIKKYADDNKKNGFGYTISPFMLQLAILNAETGLKQLKGHVVTQEESEISKRVYKWLLDKGFIKPIVYAVKEDPNVRVYMPEYTGKTADTKVKMIPYNKSTGYMANKITSFAVSL